jgi:phage terminase small subunit
MTTTKRLNPKQECFCQLYATEVEFFANGTQSYIEAYKPKQVGNWYQTARARAYELLTSPHILARINELLESGYLNNEHVDKQLGLMCSHRATCGHITI